VVPLSEQEDIRFFYHVTTPVLNIFLGQTAVFTEQNLRYQIALITQGKEFEYQKLVLRAWKVIRRGTSHLKRVTRFPFPT
jgi:hypothetical protein